MRNLIFLTLAALPLFLSAQETPKAGAFEAASVKAAEAGNMNGVRGGCRGVDSKSNSADGVILPIGRCVITDGRLSHLIMIAWQLKTILTIENAPDWVIGGDERFTIQAKAENPKATEAELLGMLQGLLVERFQLTFHREDRQESGFSLMVAKGGPKLENSKDDDVTRIDPFDKGNPTRTISAHRYSMTALASLLSAAGPGNVTDETGLTDSYNFKLIWNNTEGPSVFSALQQLGLRLEPRKTTVSYFVIDSAQRPGAN
jgi:uncharacterized protein (TIGR03435 family)